MLTSEQPSSISVQFAAIHASQQIVHWNRCVVAELEDVNCFKAAKKRDVIGLLAGLGQYGIRYFKACYDPICKDDVDMDSEGDSE